MALREQLEEIRRQTEPRKQKATQTAEASEGMSEPELRAALLELTFQYHAAVDAAGDLAGMMLDLLDSRDALSLRN